MWFFQPRQGDDIGATESEAEAPDVSSLPPLPEADSLDFESTESLLQVLEVCPDVDINFAQDLLCRHDTSVSDVIQYLLEDDSYPKQKEQKDRNGVEASSSTAAESEPLSKKQKLSEKYISQSVVVLLHSFPFLSKRKALNILKAASNHYATAHDTICRTLLQHEPIDNNQRPFEEILFSLLFDQQNLEKAEIDLCGRLFGLRPHIFQHVSTLLRRKLKSPKINAAILVDEIRFVNLKLQELKQDLEGKITRRKQRKASILAGTSMVCNCCFDDAAPEELVPCRNGGHLFCMSCLSKYIETQLFGNGNFGIDPNTKKAALDILCCHGDGCSSHFDRTCLEQVLKPKVLQKYDELQYQVAIETAGLRENIVTCPTCDAMFELTPDQKFFVCPGCKTEACRHCGGPNHIPLRCEEVEKEQYEEKARIRVEEAATEAVIRKCPSCGKGCVKIDGCNRVVCACRTKFCYCCLKDKVLSYNHFCNDINCTHDGSIGMCDNKCPLYTDDVTADQLARRHAAETEAHRVLMEGLAKPTASAVVKVDVDSVLKSPFYYN